MLETLRSARWKDVSQKVARALGILLLFVFVALILLLSLPKKQHRLSITHDFGIGFDLNPSYGYVIGLVYSNGVSNSIAELLLSLTSTVPFNQLPELKVIQHIGK